MYENEQSDLGRADVESDPDVEEHHDQQRQHRHEEQAEVQNIELDVCTVLS